MGPSLKNFWLAIVAAATAATDVATTAALLVRAYEDEDLRGPCGGHRRLLLSAALVLLLNMIPSDSRQSQGEGECDNLGPLQFIWGYASWKRHFKSNSSPTNGLTLLSTLSKIHSRGRSAHSLYMASNLSCRHHHFPDKPMRFPRLPPPTANCFSLGVMCKRLGRLGSICDLNTGISQQRQLRARGKVPSLRVRYAAAITDNINTLLVRGGKTNIMGQNGFSYGTDDSLYSICSTTSARQIF